MITIIIDNKEVEITEKMNSWLMARDTWGACCTASKNSFYCTRPAGHAGNHVAHGADEAASIFEQEQE